MIKPPRFVLGMFVDMFNLGFYDPWQRGETLGALGEPYEGKTISD
jgi:hypothetical protein